MELFRDYYLNATGKYKDKTAYRDPETGESYSYGEFDDYVRRIASKLSASGLKAGESCVIAMSHTIGYIAVMHACVLSGIVYVPQAAAYPEERIRMIQEDANARLVLRDEFLEDVRGYEPMGEFPVFSPDTLALIIYTSGSTGKPKGVMHTQVSFAKAVQRWIRIAEFRGEDVYGGNAPFYFILHVQDCFAAFARGISTVLIPDEKRGDPKGLAGYIEREGISVTFISPKVLTYFRKQGSRLRRVITGSERVSFLFPDGFTLVNTYGMSETGAATLRFDVDRRYDNTPIGYPVGDECVYVLDGNGKETDEGELCISGDLSSGYRNMPELTENTFVKNPFEDEDGHKILLHTGDLVKRIPSGGLLYLNRKDWMIKINGQRVEPGEIEAALKRMEQIKDACVKDFTLHDGQTIIAAYYVSEDDQDIDADILKESLAASLPGYMIPAYFIRLDRLPVNANGKLDRKALKAPQLSEYSSRYAAPETKEQEEICGAFSELLGVERVGIDDDFFSLGGDSIKTLVLANRLDKFGLNKSDIFAAHTPRELASRIAGAGSRTMPLAEYAALNDVLKEAYPLTESQLSIYLDSGDADRATIYNNVMGLFLPAEGNPESAEERLTEAVRNVLSSYPILKCHVGEVQGIPSLIYQADMELIIDVRKTDETDRAKIAKDFIKPFDLAHGPLIRACLYENPEGLFLLLDVHHIVNDGTSMSILVENIGRAYAGCELRKEQVTNLTLAAYENEKLAEIRDDDNAYYRHMLDGMDGDTEIYPDDDPALKEREGRLGVYCVDIFDLQEDFASRFTETMQAGGITESTVFFGAYAYLLRLLSGQKKVLVFTGENGRTDPLLYDTFGMMVHNIPVLVDIDEAVSSTEYLQAVQDKLFACIGHDRAAFSTLLGEYHIKPEYTFVYQGDMLSGVTMDGRYIPLELYKSEDVMDNLTLHVLKQPGGSFLLRFEYGAGLYTEDTVKRIARLYARLVSGLLGDARLCEIPLIGAEEISEQEAGNATEQTYEISDIVTLFKKAVKKHPDNNAVFYKGQMLSYREVDEISDRIASFLRSKGIQKGKVVSVLISRSAYMVTASLGVLKTGAAYQPLDPSYPVERLTFMMQDADAAYLIADREMLSKVPEYRGGVLLTCDIPELPAGAPVMAGGPDEDSLFILLYTSGSTGTPKGVKILHRNLANFCGWYREFYALDATSKVAAYASYGFDADMMDLYPALTTGACVYIIEEEIRLDLLALENYFNKHMITHCFMTTQVGRQFYTMASPASLKFLSTGGEKLVPLSPVESGLPFYNVYGPTECTILSTAKLMDRLYGRVPIGKPIGNYKVYVADEYGRQLPALVPGELLISGAGVSAGYLNREDLTEKVFIRNPYTSEPGYERIYRSGDIVRLLANGEVDFIGRNDGQVKVRGFRIELTEVEAVIRKFPGIKDATVQAFEEEASGEKYIAAYVVSDDTVDIPAMNEFIRREKPPYMIPAVTMQLDAIPLNQNQKVNKRALPKPERAHRELVAPQNAVQQQIFDCVADVIGHKDFGIDMDLYEAGLSSIGAIKLNVLLSKTFDMVFTTRDLKEQNTIEKLEDFIEERKSGTGAQEADLSVQTEYSLSKTQEGVYVECIAKPGTCVYNIPLLLEIDSLLETDRLKSAIVAVVNAHPFLKTRLFVNDDGDVKMRRMDADFSFDEACVEVRRAAVIEDVKDSLITPFKIMGGRLFRTSIIETEDARKFLFLEMHHLVSDGTSMGIFLNDISRAYEGESLQTEQYSGYEAVLSEKHARTAKRLEDMKGYYAKLLEEAETQSLPLGDIADGTSLCVSDHASKAAGLMETDGVNASVSEIRKFCTENGLTLNAYFSAAFGHLLNAYLNTESVVFAGIYNGRSDSRLAQTVAMLVKTIPIVACAKAGESVTDHVKTLGKQLSDTQANDLYSFAEVSREAGVNADVMFAYQGDEFAFDTFCGKKSSLLPLDLGTVKAPLNVNVYLTGDVVHYSFEYDTARFSQSYIRSMADSLDLAVGQMLTKERMADISFVTGEMEKELAAFNDTDVKTVEAFAPDRMAQAAEKYADRAAVIARSGKAQLTFKELDARANKIANTLIQRGIGRGRRVGLYMERTEDVYAIRQGILKAGAAFVSLEPDYPDERISFIVNDAAISVLITTKKLYDERWHLLDDIAEVLILSDIYASDVPDCAPAKVRIKESDTAYCIYTSGSTGAPKGVEITHGNLRNLLDYNDKNTLAHAYVDHSTRFLALAAITFDVSIIEEMMPLYHGKTVVMATEDEIHNPMLLLDTIKKTGVDMMKCTPSYMLSILDVQAAADVFKQLNALILGAEPFPKGMYEKLRNAGFAGTVFNSYGPTETCVSVSIGELAGKYVTIGGPNANTRFYIRDRFGNILPKYMRGELVIAGSCVGNGYVGLPEKTKEVFTTLSADGRSYPAYRSGDVAYFNASGEIMHCGRNDNQVKIRGLRVELDGIENTMNTYPGIEQSVVLVLGEGDGKYLAGYYVAKHPVDENDLMSHLRKTLTAYMVPGVYVYLEKLPMTINGKVNKKALPRPEAKKKEMTGKAASTALQKEIAALFAKALSVDDVGINEDFFEMGGTSMLASKVAMGAMVKGLPIAYQDVFAYPTVGQMEAHVLEAQGAAAPVGTDANTTSEKDAAGSEPIALDGSVDTLLGANSLKYIAGITENYQNDLGTVLLTGATGFLGIHVLGYLMDHTSSHVICLIRKGSAPSAEKREKSLMTYYFDKPYDEEFESGRIRVIDGDITDKELVAGIEKEDFDIVINCAACVKHFAKDDILDRVNVIGVKNLIALCKKKKRRLIQISTVSVAGENVDHALSDHLKMDETMLYFGQDLSNQYVHSKFEAERAMLTDMAKGELDGKIIRVGNLMSRASDGEFQANAVTSGFMRNLLGYAAIGGYPVSQMARPVEFSPIEKVAEAVVRLSGTSERYTVFHAVNGHWIEMGDLIAAMNHVGIPVEVVDDAEFERRLQEALADDQKNMLVSGLISYLSSDAGSVRSYVPEDHIYTTNVLYRLGFRWPLTDERYLSGAMESLKTLGFFDKGLEQEK